VVRAVADSLFRLRINFQKRGVLRFLSHLELVRCLERTVRRAQLPYAISNGFNAHMRHAPGPALPVGTVGLDEYFDVWLTEYLKPSEVLANLQHASARDLDVIGVSYVDPKAKGLQATHTHETYEVILGAPAASVTDALGQLIATGVLTTQRKNKKKVYDLTSAIDRQPEVTEQDDGLLAVRLFLQSTEQGSIRPELLLTTALGPSAAAAIKSITRIKLSEE
jgi:radical SAM-linked protein